jgi:CDP-glucose 4,6-dehydratase
MPPSANSFWKNRNVFVTGCTGLLGSWLVDDLLKHDARVVGLVRDVVPESQLYRSKNIDRIIIVRGSLEELPLLERAIGEYEIDAIFHLAAQAIVGTANRNPLPTLQTNIAGSWNVFEAARRSDGLVKRIIVASSDKAYGSHEKLPYTEEAPLQGKYPYDVSKSCTDLIAQMYFATYSLPVCVTRSANMFGGGDLNFNRIIPGTIRSALHNERPVIRSDGTFVRDYIYVPDVVSAYLAIAEKMDDKTVAGEAFNISTDNRLSVIDLTNLILRSMNRTDLAPVILNEAKSEIKEQYLSAKKLEKVVGWKGHHTVEQALDQTIRWYRQFFDAAKF